MLGLCEWRVQFAGGLRSVSGSLAAKGVGFSRLHARLEEIPEENGWRRIVCGLLQLRVGARCLPDDCPPVGVGGDIHAAGALCLADRF